MRQTMKVQSGKITRPSYHHGDLANALTGAALELARGGGPDAVVLREAARQIGVSPTAAYRHFSNREDLIHAVKDCALLELAGRMQQEVGRAPAEGELVDQLRERLLALGRGYIGFALENPGLFHTAFAHMTPIVAGPGADRPAVDPMETPPFRMLVDLLDRLAEAGVIAAGRRPFLEFAAWATVHGMAQLLLDGPMRDMPADLQQAAVARALDMVTDGIIACAPDGT
ncbi:TetR/AcrR family transcriptional regulator [Dactylosporangium sp. CA-092794]|uniref:TetR/AcrR family transcriptional regulator n=1 Tax=Dactylosporangium sp. CA-092794 TaxID=3239929 RepID=UPI003D8DDA67